MIIIIRWLTYYLFLLHVYYVLYKYYVYLFFNLLLSTLLFSTSHLFPLPYRHWSLIRHCAHLSSWSNSRIHQVMQWSNTYSTSLPIPSFQSLPTSHPPPLSNPPLHLPSPLPLSEDLSALFFTLLLLAEYWPLIVSEIIFLFFNVLYFISFKNLYV